MKINASEIRVGMLIEYRNDLWQVLKTQHVKPGKGGAFAQVEMKSVNKNTKLNERFRSSETVEKASLEETKYNFLYEDERNYFFMNPTYFMQKPYMGLRWSSLPNPATSCRNLIFERIKEFQESLDDSTWAGS